MTNEAEEYFYDWYNGIIEYVNAIEKMRKWKAGK